MKLLFVFLLIILIFTMNSNSNKQLRKKSDEKRTKSFEMIENDLMKSDINQIETNETNENVIKKPKRRESKFKRKKESKKIEQNYENELKTFPSRKRMKSKESKRLFMKSNNEKRKIQNVTDNSTSNEKKPKMKDESLMIKLQKEVDRGIEIPKPKETICKKKQIYTPLEGLLRMNTTLMKIRKSLPQSDPTSEKIETILEPSTLNPRGMEQIIRLLSVKNATMKECIGFTMEQFKNIVTYCTQTCVYDKQNNWIKSSGQNEIYSEDKVYSTEFLLFGMIYYMKKCPSYSDLYDSLALHLFHEASNKTMIVKRFIDKLIEGRLLKIGSKNMIDVLYNISIEDTTCIANGYSKFFTDVAPQLNNCFYVTDGRIQRISKKLNDDGSYKIEWFSPKHNDFGIKYLIFTDYQQKCIRITDCFHGAAHDTAIYKKEFDQKMIPNDVYVLADSGFTGCPNVVHVFRRYKYEDAMKHAFIAVEQVVMLRGSYIDENESPIGFLEVIFKCSISGFMLTELTNSSSEFYVEDENNVGFFEFRGTAEGVLDHTISTEFTNSFSNIEVQGIVKVEIKQEEEVVNEKLTPVVKQYCCLIRATGKGFISNLENDVKLIDVHFIIENPIEGATPIVNTISMVNSLLSKVRIGVERHFGRLILLNRIASFPYQLKCDSYPTVIKFAHAITNYHIHLHPMSKFPFEIFHRSLENVLVNGEMKKVERRIPIPKYCQQKMAELLGTNKVHKTLEEYYGEIVDISINKQGKTVINTDWELFELSEDIEEKMKNIVHNQIKSQNEQNNGKCNCDTFGNMETCETTKDENGNGNVDDETSIWKDEGVKASSVIEKNVINWEYFDDDDENEYQSIFEIVGCSKLEIPEDVKNGIQFIREERISSKKGTSEIELKKRNSSENLFNYKNDCLNQIQQNQQMNMCSDCHIVDYPMNHNINSMNRSIKSPKISFENQFPHGNLMNDFGKRTMEIDVVKTPDYLDDETFKIKETNNIEDKRIDENEELHVKPIEYYYDNDGCISISWCSSLFMNCFLHCKRNKFTELFRIIPSTIVQSILNTTGSGYPNDSLLMDWNKEVSTLNKILVFIFNINNSHWTCGFYFNKDRVLYIVDSLSPKRFLKSVTMFYKPLQLFFLNKFLKKDISIELIPIERQKNNWECGYRTLHCINKICRNETITKKKIQKYFNNEDFNEFLLELPPMIEAFNRCLKDFSPFYKTPIDMFHKLYGDSFQK